MTDQQIKSEEWLNGYHDGLITAKKIVRLLSRLTSVEMAEVFDVMID